MGRTLQCESSNPGYYSMRDLNEDASSSNWSLYHDEKTLNISNYYNNFVQRPAAVDGYSEYDKEVLKQTMLKHEAIFRKQVFELHRLYRIQMDLMDDVKRKEIGKYSVPVEASQSSPFSQMQSADAQKMWNMPSRPSAESGCNRASVQGTGTTQPVLEFIKVSSVQVSPVPTQNGSNLKDGALLESKSVKNSRRTFDLQLPADEYNDSEEGEPIEKEKVPEVSGMGSCSSKRNCGIPSESDVKLSLGSRLKPSSRGDTYNFDSCLMNKPNLADLNEPIQVEDAAASVPVNFFGSVCQREILGQDVPAKPNSSIVGLPKDFFQKTHQGNSGSHVNVINLENGDNRREWLACNFDAGQCSSKLNPFPQGLCTAKLRTPSESVQVDNRIQREPWNGSGICGTDISKRSQSQSNRNISGPLAPCTPSPNSIMPHYDVTDSGSPSVSSWRTPLSSLSQKQTVQTRSHFDTATQLTYKSSIQNPGLIPDKWNHLNYTPKLKSSIGNEPSYQNGFYHQWSQSEEANSSQIHFPSINFGFLKYKDESTTVSEQFENQHNTKYFNGSDCRKLKSPKDMMNLNLAPSNVSQQDVVIIDEEEENEGPAGGLRSQRPVCNKKLPKENGFLNKRGLNFLQGYSQEVADKIKKEKDPISSSTQDFRPFSCSQVVEPEKTEVGECSSLKKILGFPIFDKPLSKDLYENKEAKDSVKFRGFDMNLSLDPEISDTGEPQFKKELVVGKVHDKEIPVSCNYFNLNSPVNVEEEEEAVLTSSLPRASEKIAVEIDLEVPLVPETEESIPSGSKSMEVQVRPVQVSHAQTQEIPDEVVRAAAEAIVIMSSSVIYYQTDNFTSCQSSEESIWDSLHWFAGIVSTNTVNLESEVGLVLTGKEEDKTKECFSDEIDYFESMTLKLTETKVDEYWCSKPSWEFDDQNEYEEGKCASLLLTRRRRGQARRGRQRRDFQRDILPGLASLSRHEVTEDLQTIGGLMRATGCPWQSGLTRRNSTRNGCARGRRRSGGVSPTMTVTEISPPPEQPNNSEQGLDKRSLQGWGKTTRRPRRQRFAAGNPTVPLTEI